MLVSFNPLRVITQKTISYKQTNLAGGLRLYCCTFATHVHLGSGNTGKTDDADAADDASNANRGRYFPLNAASPMQ